MAELSKRVSGVFDEAKGYRATLIANNETNQAYQYANHQTLDVMYAQGIIDKRKWLTAGDSRVRPTHAELNEYTVRFNTEFPGGLEPGSEINCRCSEIGLRVGEGDLS